MSRFLAVRAFQAVLTIFLMSILVFGLVRLTGSPLDYFMPPYAGQEQFEAEAERLGLDKPIYVQYWRFAKNAVQGDFGESLYFNEPALDVVIERFPATVQLATVALFFALVFSIPLGVASASRPGSAFDHGGRLVALIGQAVPNFWLGILLIAFFAVGLGWFPTSGRGGLLHLVLPAITMGAYLLAGLLRLTRSAMRDSLTSEFVTFANVKGVPRRIVIWKHALRSALIPVVTFAGLVFAQLLVGSIVVETVFSWPGVGRLAFQAASQRDFPLLQTVVIAFTGVFVFLSFLVDVLYSFLDPRVRT